MSRLSPFSWFFGRSTSSSSSASAAASDFKSGGSRMAKGGDPVGNGEGDLGVTEELRAFVAGFTIDSFKGHDALLQSQDGDGVHVDGTNVRKDLTDWQERHAVLILSRVKELSRLRYVLCPRHMKENQFWRIYFLLVKHYISLYEIRAIQKEKLKKMEIEEEKSAENGVTEVEMTETKPAITDISQTTGQNI